MSDSVSEILQYSTSNSKLTKVNYSNSTVKIHDEISKSNPKLKVLSAGEVFGCLSDIIPEDDYKPFYVSRYRQLGYKRFLELANKARGGKNPPRLFFWMLKNNEIVI